MEKLNEKCCRLLPGNHNFEKAEPKAVTKPQDQLHEVKHFADKTAQKPWSVFEGVYWI